MTAPAFAPPVALWERKTDADIVIVGVGIPGLSFSLRLPDSLRIVIVTKGPLGASNAWYAQGGIAAAVGPDDDPDVHLQDTIAAGAGLTDIDAARAMAERGPSAVRWLLRQGTNFDLHGHVLALGHEAAHSR